MPVGFLTDEQARRYGSFVGDPTPDQLAVAGSAELMATYAASEGRWRHGPRIRERYGYL